MKKAKIFLTALTVLAITGGGLAFKVTIPIRFAQCDLSSRICKLNTLTTIGIKTTNIGGIIADYDILGKNCVFDPNVREFTCTTQTTTDILE
ncbi:hypothetical protein [Niastella sp. OAS944]|uniref:hypothetical protein n=1 Tax=Niastella sp. OAS944 TaxID=2664089 RepID=UPI0035C7B812|nr:hypothetical protein [Chitinophagaceae bacterium OAS944]